MAVTTCISAARQVKHHAGAKTFAFPCVFGGSVFAVPPLRGGSHPLRSHRELLTVLRNVQSRHIEQRGRTDVGNVGMWGTAEIDALVCFSQR